MRALRILRAEPLAGSVRFCFVYRGKRENGRDDHTGEQRRQRCGVGALWSGAAVLHRLLPRASPECTDTACRARLFQFFRRTVVRDRKTIPYSVLVRKTFYISYAAFSSVMQTDEFCFCITFEGNKRF